MKNVESQITGGIEMIHSISSHLRTMDDARSSIRTISDVNEDEGDKINALLSIAMAVLLLRRAIKLWRT